MRVRFGFINIVILLPDAASFRVLRSLKLLVSIDSTRRKAYSLAVESILKLAFSIQAWSYSVIYLRAIFEGRLLGILSLQVRAKNGQIDYIGRSDGYLLRLCHYCRHLESSLGFHKV
jgi:hypothetical protein